MNVRFLKKVILNLSDGSKRNASPGRTAKISKVVEKDGKYDITFEFGTANGVEKTSVSFQGDVSIVRVEPPKVEPPKVEPPKVADTAELPVVKDPVKDPDKKTWLK